MTVIWVCVSRSSPLVCYAMYAALTRSTKFALLASNWSQSMARYGACQHALARRAVFDACRLYCRPGVGIVQRVSVSSDDQKKCAGEKPEFLATASDSRGLTSVAVTSDVNGLIHAIVPTVALCAMHDRSSAGASRGLLLSQLDRLASTKSRSCSLPAKAFESHSFDIVVDPQP